MIGILNEKPSQMRNFAKALGGNEGSYNGENYILTAAHGHLFEFKDPKEQVDSHIQGQYASWALTNLPWDEKDMKWLYQQKPDAAETLKKIRDTLSKCTEIVIATDDDPTGEGELLAWEILSELKLSPKKWSRMYFEDESAAEIQKAFKNRKTIQDMEHDNDYIKAKYRACWDFMSMQFTRIATKYGGEVLRQGRLKSYMVVLVGDQLKAINEYKKIPYYQNRFKDENDVIYINPNEKQYPTKEEVPQDYKNSDVVIDSIEDKAAPPPKLLDLAGLASILAPRGISSKTVTATYQKMYEAQVVSYPRTEDKCITIEQFNQLLPLVDKIADVVGVDKKLLTHKKPRPTHVKAGMAHGANRPGINVPKSLNGLDAIYGQGAAAIYELLAKNYLAILGEDYIYEQQKGHIKDYPKFVGSVNIPKELGYKKIFCDEDEKDLNESVKGLGKSANPFIHEGFPQKPQQPTMKWLMKQLEKYDVGTGATRTSTYTEVTSKTSKTSLLTDTKGKINMTQAGQKSYYLLPNTNIGSPTITESVMSDMKAIAKGEKNFEECLHNIQRLVCEDMETMRKNALEMPKELQTKDVQKPTDYIPKEKFEGKFGKKQISFNRTWSGHTFTDEECEKLLAGEEITVTAVSSKSGKEFTCYGKLEQQTFNGNKFYGFKSLGFVNQRER
jgi:DNA topoisomerase-3